MERIITVKGTGKVRAMPDLITLSMTLTSDDLVYEKALADADQALEHIREALIAEEFNKDELKTANFSINPVYENARSRNDEFKQTFRGYRVSHDLTLEFKFDSRRLGRVLSAITASSAVPEFRIGFSVKDQDALSARMLQNAVANARLKAEIIADAAGLQLGEIISIDYSSDDALFHSPTQFGLRSEKMSVSSMALDIQPEDSDIIDSVTIHWQISKTNP